MTGDGRDIPAEEGVTIEDAAELRPGPVPGREPGERLERGHWQPPVESDPPPRVAGDDGGGFDTSFLTPQAEAEQEHAEPADPGAEPEDEGIPDLQDGGPMQQRSSDPQQESVPGDTPTAVTRAAPTPAEMRAGRVAGRAARGGGARGVRAEGGLRPARRSRGGRSAPTRRRRRPAGRTSTAGRRARARGCPPRSAHCGRWTRTRCEPGARRSRGGVGRRRHPGWYGAGDGAGHGAYGLRPH